MYIKIPRDKGGIYANTGSCINIVLHCEQKRRTNDGGFFNQYKDNIIADEVVSKIDHNKRKLKKNEAKFFVMIVNPSTDEQCKMGETIEKRIDAFKNYIRKGVMAEYAKNFERGLSEKDIMYYAYIHMERGEKTGEQMHAHIIISRRNMDNSISLSPKSNHRSGKGVIAHGFNRDRFCNSCEKVFDVMMGYTRSVKESYEYLNAIKNGNYKDIASVTEKAMQEKYGIVSTGWDVLANAEFKKKSLSATKASEFSPEKTVEEKYDVDLADWDRLVNGEFNKETVAETSVPQKLH